MRTPVLPWADQYRWELINQNFVTIYLTDYFYELDYNGEVIGTATEMTPDTYAGRQTTYVRHSCEAVEPLTTWLTHRVGYLAWLRRDALGRHVQYYRE